MGDASRMIRLGAQRLIGAVLDCEKPVIAAVNGTAAGIGAHIAFACDLVIAADTGKFIEVFVRRGIAPDGGGAYLLARLDRPAESQGADLLRRRPARRRTPARWGSSTGWSHAQNWSLRPPSGPPASHRGRPRRSASRSG